MKQTVHLAVAGYVISINFKGNKKNGPTKILFFFIIRYRLAKVPVRCTGRNKYDSV
jgi:hypothetical protein